MPTVSVKIPQLGEGLQEARLVEFLKKPGDAVKKDEPIFEIETDKAITEIESPYTGTLVSWSADVDAVLPIGTEIGTMEVSEGSPAASSTHPGPVAPTAAPTVTETPPTPIQPTAPFAPEDTPAPPQTAAGGAGIPPRTRRYLREKGLMHLADQIPAAGRRLQLEDVDAFIAAAGTAAASVASEQTAPTPAAPVTKTTADYTEQPLDPVQRTLNFRMARGAQVCLPAVLETDIDWTAIQAVRDRVRDSGGPTSFAMLSWCVAQAMRQHAPFRSTLSADGETLRTYAHANLGIAVSLDNDALLTAVVRNAETLPQAQFFSEMSSRIQDARAGKDQVDGTTTVTVSNIGTAGMRMGIPVVVTPAVATIAIGAVRDEPVPISNGFTFRKKVSMTMAFDHRLVNGIGAARFLNTICTLASDFRLD